MKIEKFWPLKREVAAVHIELGLGFLFSFIFVNLWAIYRKKSNTIHPEIPNSDLRIETDVPRVYPAFRTQWNRFRKLTRSSVRVTEINDQV